MQTPSIASPVRDTLKRYRVVRRLSALFDITLGPLALIAVSLFIAELLIDLSSPWDDIVYTTQFVIWGIFLVAFAVELKLAPQKLLYLRRNWLLVLALILPALRVLRLARAIQFIARGSRLARALTSLNRARAAIEGFLGFSQVALVLSITAVVWLTSAGLVLFYESGAESPIDSAGDALWWAAAVITTVGVGGDPISPEGRFVAITLRVFGVAVIGYFTARLAAYFFGSREAQQNETLEAMHQELAALRQELQSRSAERREP